MAPVLPMARPGGAVGKLFLCAPMTGRKRYPMLAPYLLIGEILRPKASGGGGATIPRSAALRSLRSLCPRKGYVPLVLTGCRVQRTMCFWPWKA